MSDTHLGEFTGAHHELRNPSETVYCLEACARLGKKKVLCVAQYSCCVLHREWLQCAPGAMARHYFDRWHLQKEAPPDFHRRKSWYHIRVLKGADREIPLSSKAATAGIADQYIAAGTPALKLKFMKKLHQGRKHGSRGLSHHGLDRPGIDAVGFWGGSKLSGVSHASPPFLTHVLSICNP